jgi:hypothetical protein
MSASNGRRTRLFAISSIVSAIGACTGPDTDDCNATATCAANGPDASAAGDDASNADAQTEADATAQNTDGRTDAAGDGDVETGVDGPDAGPGGCVTNDNCGPGTLCGEDGVCVPGCTQTHACPSGQACCSSVCVDMMTDATHCGACDVICAAENGTAKCDQGACTVASCSTGHIDCNHSYADGCETPDPGPPQAPALMTPTIGTYAGSVHAPASLKPTFTWQPVAAPGTCKNRYQIQLDPTCAPGDVQTCGFSKVTVDVSDIATTSFTPAEALAVNTAPPVGMRYYWRVRACDDLKRCSAWSRVRYVNVGRLPDDFNGDGFSDLAIERVTYDGPGYTAYADLCLGSSPLNGLPDHKIINSQGATQEASSSNYFAYVGDVNADGYADYAAGRPAMNEVGLFLGSQVIATAPQPDRVLGANVANSSFGSAVARAGDVNGDGFDDVLVGAPDSSGATIGARVYLYFGPAQVSETGRKPLVLSSDVEKFATEVRGVGDLDQDGYCDFAVAGASGLVYRGGASPTEYPVRTFPDANMLAPAGDLNGDGFDDAAFSYVAPRAAWGSVSALWGGSALTSAAIQKLFEVPAGVSGIVGGRDFNGDGLSDLLAGVPSQQRVIVVRGAKPFPATTALGDFAAFLAPASPTDSQFGLALGAGDFDGDGVFDAAIAVDTNITDSWHSGAVWLVPGKQLLTAFDASKIVRSVPLSTSDPFMYGLRIGH